MKQFKITAGEWPRIAGVPDQRIEKRITPRSAALMGIDAPRLRPKFEVEKGAHVEVGQVVFRDRKHPEIAYVAPLSGTISEISYGARRTLSACVIKADPAKASASSTAPLDSTTSSVVRQILMERGMWPALRTRPFGRTPTPDAEPSAIFVNATQSSDAAPDPHVVLASQIDEFRLGVRVLTQLTDGNVYICQTKGDAFCEPADRVVTAGFSGTIAAGLAGTHIDHLCPAQLDREVWSIGYQDVAAIGHLFETGQFSADRVICVAGSAASQPKLVRTCLGANAVDVCSEAATGRGDQMEVQILSGDEYSGHPAIFLGRFHQQITMLRKKDTREKPSSWSRLFGSSRALIPNSALERALAVDILPVPLMRALSVGDSEAAQRLGCLALVEEDVATLSRHCTSGADYGALLRQVLNDLMEATA